MTLKEIVVHAIWLAASVALIFVGALLLADGVTSLSDDNTPTGQVGQVVEITNRDTGETTKYTLTTNEIEINDTVEIEITLENAGKTTDYSGVLIKEE